MLTGCRIQSLSYCRVDPYKKDTFETDPKYLPYPPLVTQTEFNIAIVDCKEYEESIPDRVQRTQDPTFR